MNVNGKHYRSIWMESPGGDFLTLDQKLLPYQFEVIPIRSVNDAATAIEDMTVRGAPLIGATAACGMALQVRESASDQFIEQAYL
ncbi:hypothetical protein M3P05_07100 [Sansalvadorimonas sp. 2012CJ34-2]|uniref:S-methyl-5-thioribose-1-phosphate isomerase n=1 Tax=Parendozoicomonas callyspongiae TaxID=2942213 RepID=A0ABT0PE90_9GAMM|nr:hypothetical protein [Sansalvadorimonas sp. 2012CJ34-2]MCL6269704.1 hypothetical protein [Sansalvadorimonas sp. 2012CJ34-2]